MLLKAAVSQEYPHIGRNALQGVLARLSHSIKPSDVGSLRDRLKGRSFTPASEDVTFTFLCKSLNSRGFACCLRPPDSETAPAVHI